MTFRCFQTASLHVSSVSCCSLRDLADTVAWMFLRLILWQDVCVVCQEAMPAGSGPETHWVGPAGRMFMLLPGSKAKAMPCGHLFHDECLLSWAASLRQIGSMADVRKRFWTEFRSLHMSV